MSDLSPDNHVGPLALGSVLRERYELLEVIGHGGVSTVYRAVDRLRLIGRSPEPEVAIKLVVAEGDYAEWMIENIHREARYLRQLQHANIVRVFDSDQDGVFHFVVMELLHGRTIGGILQSMPRKVLPIDLILRVLERVGAGLRYAHERGIIHGDIKPNNVLVTLDGQVKLLDFGAARLIEALDVQQDFDAITPMYASLELLQGETPAESDDVYALAVLVYVMFAGTHPFRGATALQAHQLGFSPDRPLGLSTARWRGLARGLALEHQHRTDSIAAFIRDFGKPLWPDQLLEGIRWRWS